MEAMEPVVERRERGNSVYFTMYWSPIIRGDKYKIITSVPSMGGLYELYYMDDRKKLVLIERSRAWYGGLRARLRKAVDPELREEQSIRRILEEYDLYYRYTMLESRDDMIDLIYFFERLRDPRGKGYLHSGRYASIYVKEVSPNKIITM
jgi:hypothetical protein